MNNKKLLFNYGQTQLGLLLKEKYGDNFIHEQNINVDLFNPFSYFDMIDFFTNGDIDKCCNRWGWDEMDVNNILNKEYRNYLNSMRYFANDIGRNFIINLSYHFKKKN